MDIFHLAFLALHVFKTWLSRGKKRSCYLYRNHNLNREHCILDKRVVYFQLICRPRKERLHSRFNCLFHFGVREVGDIVEAPSQRVLEFLIGGLPLGLALKQRGLAMGNCFFCIVQVEVSTSLLHTISVRLSDLDIVFVFLRH